MKKTKPKPKTNTKSNSNTKLKPKHLPFEIDEKTLLKQIQTIFKLMKRSFLEVRAGSSELENEKNQTQTQIHTKPTPKPKHLPFELIKRPFQNKSQPIL